MSGLTVVIIVSVLYLVSRLRYSICEYSSDTLLLRVRYWLRKLIDTLDKTGRYRIDSGLAFYIYVRHLGHASVIFFLITQSLRQVGGNVRKSKYGSRTHVSGN